MTKSWEGCHLTLQVLFYTLNCHFLNVQTSFKCKIGRGSVERVSQREKNGDSPLGSFIRNLSRVSLKSALRKDLNRSIYSLRSLSFRKVSLHKRLSGLNGVFPFFHISSPFSPFFLRLMPLAYSGPTKARVNAKHKLWPPGVLKDGITRRLSQALAVKARLYFVCSKDTLSFKPSYPSFLATFPSKFNISFNVDRYTKKWKPILSHVQSTPCGEIARYTTIGGK